MSVEMPILIAGERRETGTPLVVTSPWSGEAVATCFEADESAIEAAVAAADQARETVRTLPAHRRKEILRRVARTLEQERDRFAERITAECGKPIGAARGEVERAVLTFRMASEEVQREEGEVLRMDVHPKGEGRFGLTRRVPRGAVLAFTPFNFPLNLVAHKVAPAIACGAPVVVKPSPKAPLSALALGEAVLAAGWPKDALSVLPTSNEGASRLLEDDRFAVFTFTGGPIGWNLKARVGRKRVLLELGGIGQTIVARDADLALAAERCVSGAFYYSGQSCISVQRILAHASIVDPLRDLLLEKMEGLTVGDPALETTDLGPVIDDEAADRIADWVKEARSAGAACLRGGGREGRLLEPTLLEDVPSTVRLDCREVFGPVVALESFPSFEAACRRANDTPWGLQIGIFTNDLTRVTESFDRLQFGGILVNEVPNWRVDDMPYGGAKASGLGREGLKYAIREYTEPRLLIVNPLGTPG